MRAPFDHPRIGVDVTEDQLQQGGFARAIRPDQTHAVTALHDAAKLFDDLLGTIGFADIDKLGDQLARALARIQRKIHFAQLFAAGCAFAAQLLQPPYTTFIPSAARLDPLANPHFLFLQHLVESRVFLRLGVQGFGFTALIIDERSRIAHQQSPVELDNARRDGFQKTPVVADHQHRAGIRRDGFLQPPNAFDIEMIGRLIEQQQIRGSNQGACQRHPFSQSTGERSERRVLVDAQPRDRVAHPRLQ